MHVNRFTIYSQSDLDLVTSLAIPCEVLFTSNQWTKFEINLIHGYSLNARKPISYL